LSEWNEKLARSNVMMKDLTLAFANAKHFRPVQGLGVETFEG
jgi:hypothetical protein